MKRRHLLVAISLVLAFGASLIAGTARAAAAEEGDTIALAMVVKLIPGAATDLTQLAGDFGATSIEPLLATRDVYLVHGPHSATFNGKNEAKIDGDAKDWLKDIEKDDRVLWSEIDLQVSAHDLRFHAWRFHAWPYGDAEPVGAPLASEDPMAALSLDEAHLRATGAGVRIAVLDTGIDTNHELLTGRVFAQYDLVDDDGDASEQANGIDDDNDGHTDEAYGHGTFVAGVIAQVAPGAEIYALRVVDDDGSAEVYALVEAIDMAIAMDVDIINTSFGLSEYRKIETLDDALKRAEKADILIVAAAGNLGDDRRSYPASENHVVSVAAIGESTEFLAPFSSRGKWVAIAAPGVGITSSVPGGGYAVWAGTSMATPIVSGLAALLYEASPEDHRKPNDIAKALFEGARKMQDKDATDHGSVDILASLDRLH